jgi:polysaccharide pyruvyl transferase WcaK-like protein
VDKKNIAGVVRAFIRNDTILIGGGGLWGMDVNLNIFLLSILLWIARYILRKRISLIGVGYYGSTTFLGRISAYIAAISANRIIARDQESFDNFKRINRQVHLDKDMAFYLPDFDLSDYKAESNRFITLNPVANETVILGLRRFKTGENYRNIIKTLQTELKQDLILAFFEPTATDPAFYSQYASLENIKIMHFNYNPIVLYHYFLANQKKLFVIAPQYHVQLLAGLANVPFLTLAYDNKNVQLHRLFNLSDSIPMSKLNQLPLAHYVKERFQ